MSGGTACKVSGGHPEPRDLGTESLPAELVRASKLHSMCNGIQTMEGNVDTAHTSHLHRLLPIMEAPEDGTDRPPYHPHASSWKCWWLDRAPRIEVSEEWYGFCSAGLRTTPNGRTLARVTAYVFP